MARFSDGSIRFALLSDGADLNNWHWVNTNLTADLNTWTHVSLVHSGSVVTVYLNGGSAAGGQEFSINTANPSTQPPYPQAPNTVNASDRPLWIGGRTEADQYFHGNIADVRIWNDVRTATEIANNYEITGLDKKPI